MTPGTAAASGVPEPGLTVAAVARRLGVAPATLRTWDRRYGLGPSGRTAGSHRRYTPEDLERLAHMRRLTLQGVAPSEAAAFAMAADTSPSGELGPESAQAQGGLAAVTPLPRAPTPQGLVRAALSLDSAACSELLSAALERRGVVATWQDLVVPVMVAIGNRWAATGKGVDVEHLLSETVMAALRPVVVRLKQPRNPRPVLLASAEDEQHSLPLHALAAALAERAIACRVMGGRVPREALAAAVARSGPAAVFVWSQLESTADVAQLSALPAQRPAPTLVAGGPGWAGHELPPGVLQVEDLTEAIERISAASLP